MYRRSFIKNVLSASALAALPHGSRLLAETPPKRLLILGGTYFLGPALVEGAIAGGHTVTLFNRGVTNPDLFPHIETIHGFRSPNPEDENLDALGRRHWDAVIDVWPHDPALVELAARRLKDRTDHYLYVSSISAYDKSRPDVSAIHEEAPLATWDGHASFYSRGKAESERRLHSIIGQKLTIVRPGGIKGVRDDTPDMLIWLRRMQTMKSVIAPGKGLFQVAVVDVKDVADFLLMAITGSIYGTFNLFGQPMPFHNFLAGLRSAVHSDSELVWIPEKFLHEQGVYPQFISPWLSNFPYCRPDNGPLDSAPQAIISNQKAFDAGWQTRALRDTAYDCLESFGSRSGFQFKDTLSKQKQEEILRNWRSQSK